MGKKDVGDGILDRHRVAGEKQPGQVGRVSFGVNFQLDPFGVGRSFAGAFFIAVAEKTDQFGIAQGGTDSSG